MIEKTEQDLNEFKNTGNLFLLFYNLKQMARIR